MSAHRKLERELQLEYYRLLAAIQYDRNAAPHNLKTNQITEELSQIISHEEIESVKDVAKQRFMKDFKLSHDEVKFGKDAESTRFASAGSYQLTTKESFYSLRSQRFQLRGNSR